MKLISHVLKTVGIFFVMLGYAISSRIFPKWAAARAARMWMRVPKTAGRRMDNRTSPGRQLSVELALPKEVTHLKRGTHTNGITHLNIATWGSDSAPIVYLVPGWGGWHGQLGTFVNPLVEAGYRVIGFDAASHGFSESGEYGSRHSAAPELRRSFQAVVKHFGQPHGIIAHSLGCAAALGALREDVTTTRLALLAPSPKMDKYLEMYGRRLRLSKRAQKLLRPSVETMSGEVLDGCNTILLASNPSLPPGLVVHDQFDKEVRLKTAENIVAAWAGSRLLTTQGLGHHRILKDPDVVVAVTTEIIN